ICCRSNSVRNNNARRAGAAAGGAASTGCVDATYIIRAASCSFGNRPRELIDQVWQMLTHHASWPYLLPARLPLSPVIVPLLSRPRLPAPLLLRSPGVLCPRIAGVGGWRTPVARRAGCFTNRAIFSIVLGVTRFLVRH